MIYYVSGKWVAFNRETRERMEKPTFPKSSEYMHNSEWYAAYYRYVSEMKVWDAFVETMPPAHQYERPKLVHATEKGIPVPGVHKYNRRKYKNGAGVSANSRVLSHHYRDEGETGRSHRREIKRKEEAVWRCEALTELGDDREAWDARTWFEGSEWWEYEENYDALTCGDPDCEICG